MGEIKSIAILGAGAMGAAYASMFSNVEGLSTVFVARGERYERLSREGIVVNEKPYAVAVVHPDEADRPADLVMVALKHHHLPDAVHDLKALVGDETTMISVMNGLVSEEVLGAGYGMDKLLYCIAVGIDAVREGGRVTYSIPGKIFFGEALNIDSSPRVRAVEDLLNRAGIPARSPKT